MIIYLVTPSSGTGSSAAINAICNDIGYTKITFTISDACGSSPNEKANRIKQLEMRSRIENQSQIFMETPYRNQKLLDDLFKTCSLHTRLCIATDITMDSEYIKTKTIAEWKANPPDIHKRSTIFILHA